MARLQGPPLHERALAALDAHHQLLRAIEQEPARRRDLDEPAASARWTTWYDKALTPAWERRDDAITLLLGHADYPRWHAGMWRDGVTADSRVPYVWRPVATMIVAETPR